MNLNNTATQDRGDEFESAQFSSSKRSSRMSIFTPALVTLVLIEAHDFAYKDQNLDPFLDRSHALASSGADQLDTLRQTAQRQDMGVFDFCAILCERDSIELRK